MAKASSLLALAPLLGPIAGGYLQVAYGWHAAFVALTAIGAVTLLACSRWLHETCENRSTAPFSLPALLSIYASVCRNVTFWAYALPGALSYASIFVFISGSSFVLIQVLGVPTQYYGYCFAFGVTGYLGGTVLCRYLLGKHGMDRTLAIGTALSLFAGTFFLAAVLSGFEHWLTVLLAQFLTMAAHGINFPCAQAGAMSPFPDRAGAAAGFLGFFTMALALAAGTSVGSSHGDTLLPLAVNAAGVSVLLFISAQMLARHRHR